MTWIITDQFHCTRLPMTCGARTLICQSHARDIKQYPASMTPVPNYYSKGFNFKILNGKHSLPKAPYRRHTATSQAPDDTHHSSALWECNSEVFPSTTAPGPAYETVAFITWINWPCFSCLVVACWPRPGQASPAQPSTSHNSKCRPKTDIFWKIWTALVYI